MYKEKLRELLCEVPEIKKDLEELRFWSYLYWRDSSWKLNYDRAIIIWIKKITLEIYIVPILKSRIEKIENPIEERHIRMYCENTKLRFDFLQEYIQISNVFTKEKSKLIELDKTKDFDNQSETLYNELYEALLKFN